MRLLPKTESRLPADRLRTLLLAILRSSNVVETVQAFETSARRDKEILLFNFPSKQFMKPSFIQKHFEVLVVMGENKPGDWHIEMCALSCKKPINNNFEKKNPRSFGK